MSYSDFSLEELKTKFGLIFIQNQSLFSTVPVHEVSADLIRLLQYYLPLALVIDTEKAEMIAAQRLNQQKNNTIKTIYGLWMYFDRDKLEISQIGTKLFLY